MFRNNRLFRLIISSCLDLAPILAVVLVFQLAVIQQPIPNVAELIIGSLFVVLGLTFFMLGLEQSLFPIGESMANAFARKGSVFWLLLFAFCLGFGTTIAEPALIAITTKAADIAGGAHLIADNDAAKTDYALDLRLTVATSVGVAIVIGVLRILMGWPLHYFIIAGYFAVTVMTPFAPAEIIGIAYDSGGVTTSTITVPLVTALGIGLANSIKGRNPVTDGFGLIAFASLTPIIFVMAFGMLA
ncbi:hypothetical protein A1359_03100 [Methylomonas lenta]|uniref:DUF1538 domain-containing protein n=1 Tax=Methylomonas lenta TaxID=980561 RepID=A0A177NSC1_9GAMM|nr:DUF1538 domain-containing protein [Methylomonas lenta]OAI20464.1 hypothetical protein A1359_03100 [Methylomonas lenta]